MCLVSLLIVNYNSGDLLNRCLESIQAQQLDDYEVIVVDNASADGSIERAAAFPRATVVRNETNVGFAAGQNQAMRLARGRYLMPLNFDIAMTPTFLREMVVAMESSPRVGSVSGKLLYMEEPGGRPTNVIYSTGHILPADRFPLLRGHGQVDNGDFDVPEFVFGAPGAAPLYRREMLDDVAFRGEYFDESFFTWAEDVDLDWRASVRGWRSLFAPRAVAYHIGHPSGYHGALRSFQARISIRNRWMMILADECAHCLIAGAPALLWYEATLLRYVATTGLIVPYLRAVWSFARCLPRTLAKRRWVRSRAVCGCLAANSRTWGPAGAELGSAPHAGR